MAQDAVVYCFVVVAAWRVVVDAYSACLEDSY